MDKLSNEDIAEIKGLRDVAMATNFETILAANGTLTGDNDMIAFVQRTVCFQSTLCLLAALSGFVLAAVGTGR